jgi:peptide deformylase
MDLVVIRKFGDPVLGLVAGQVSDINNQTRALVVRMFAAMRKAGGIGLAAPQIGVCERVFVYDVDGVSGAVVNPVITQSSGAVASNEGCLSIPGHFFDLERAQFVTLVGTDPDGFPLEIQAEGLMAMMFQHEVDHLNGLLIIDRAPDHQSKPARRALVLGDL